MSEEITLREKDRHNQRKTDYAGRFNAVMAQTAGRRLTHRQLYGTDGCGFMGLQ